MKRRPSFVATAALLASGVLGLLLPGAGPGGQSRAWAEDATAAPVVVWSREAQRAVVPAGPGGVFGAENYGNKFPGEAAVYLGIVHAAIYDATVAIRGGYRPYVAAVQPRPGASAPAAVATAAHHVLVGLQPALGLTPPQEAGLDQRYHAYVGALPDDAARAEGIAVGEEVAAAVLAVRADDGREDNPQLAPPTAGPGVWSPGAGPALGMRLAAMRPLALPSASEFRPDGPDPMAGEAYAEDFRQVKELGRLDSTQRTEEQTETALFWTDHDLRQWNDALLGLASARALDLVSTARLLALAHVTGGDAMIACFDAKYSYWFWRPYQAVPGAGTDPNPETEPDGTWRPLRTTPNFPEYPSAHACHSAGLATALRSFFGTDGVPVSLDSRVTGTTRSYDRLHEIVKDVNEARVLAGFHFRNSDQEGAQLGRRVGRYVTGHAFQPVR